MKRNAFLSVLALLLVTVTGAYAKTVSVHVTEPGTFAEELAKQCDWTTVDTLTVSGPINADDVRQIRKMANGMDAIWHPIDHEHQNGPYLVVSRISNRDGKLVRVDLTDATFTANFEKFIFYYNDAKEIILPKQYKTRSVKFANQAFYNSKIETIGNFPENVFCIGDSAFLDCKNLKGLDWKNVATIGIRAFRGSSMKFEKFPENLTRIEKYAFYGTKNVISAPFPASLTYIGDYAFWGCTLPPEINLTDVNVGSKTCFCGTNGVKSITLTYTPNFDDSHLPKAQSFEHMKELETVKITTDFFLQANFKECSNLKNVHIPNLGNIDDCNLVNEVHFDHSDYSTGYYNYVLNFSRLLKVDRRYYGPDYASTAYGLATMDGALYRFVGSNQLSRLLMLPSGTTSYTSPSRCYYINDNAFQHCGGLEYLKLTEAQISNTALNEYLRNTKIEIPDDNPYLRKGENGFIYSFRYNYEKQECIMFATSDVQSSRTLVVDAPIFDKNSLLLEYPELTKVVIKQDVNDVTYLFPNAINLKRIEFESTTPPDVNDLDNTLAEMQKHAYDDDYFIIVPKGSEMNYMNHPFWYRFLVKSSDSVADISSDEMKVTVDGRMVRIAGIDEKESVEVVNACGQIVYSGADHEIAMPSAGIYIVRASSHVRKVIVR